MTGHVSCQRGPDATSRARVVGPRRPTSGHDAMFRAKPAGPSRKRAIEAAGPAVAPHDGSGRTVEPAFNPVADDFREERLGEIRSEERRVGKGCRSRWW